MPAGPMAVGRPARLNGTAAKENNKLSKDCKEDVNTITRDTRQQTSMPFNIEIRYKDRLHFDAFVIFKLILHHLP